MGFYDDPANVSQYIEMAKGYDGRELIDILKRYLPSGASVLELGIGPGTDLDLLSDTYITTGSDVSRVFLDRYRESHPDADLLELDAEDFSLDRSFDCIYSNKVLYHLSREGLTRSFQLQRRHLRKQGLLLHSFWYGDGEETEQELQFVYYNEHTLRDAVGDGFEVIELERYTEMDKDDSLYILLRRA